MRDELDALLDEITQHAIPASSRDSMDECWTRFERFCAARQQVALPATDETVAVFLHELAGIAPKTAKTMLQRLARTHELQGHPRPSWPVASRLAKTLVLDHANPGPTKLIGDLDESEMLTIVEDLLTPACDPITHHSRLVLAARRDGVLSAADLATCLKAETSGTSIRLYWNDNRSHLVEAGTALHEELSRDCCATPIPFGRSVQTLTASLSSLRKRLGCADLSATTVMGWSPAAYDEALALCDRYYTLRVRDWAHLIISVRGALRNVSLVNLDIADVHPTLEGYAATFRVIKRAAGEVLTIQFTHLSDPDSCHDAFCAACALRSQLAIVHGQGRADGPLFATRYTGKWRAMTRQNARLRILALWENSAEDPSAKRIATRTLRTTGATLAKKAGTPSALIARDVTSHDDVPTCQGYLRCDLGEEIHPDL